MDSRFDTLFLEARELASPAQRAAFLDHACADDAELRARLEKRLADAEAAEAYFGETTTRIDPARQPPSAKAPGEGPGSVIGRYKLLQLIGEGGMGSVYMAEQREPVIRKVALKIIKLGMDTREVVARFEAERQALAMMEHANIAKVLDAGTTEAGRPYFVMELVRGVPVTQFCDERQLPARQRLELFMDVCSAVQHAHQKGIIHRDLKPTNILVALDGERPVAKVIDFGIAKATQQRLTEKTLFTQFQQFIGTPAYMSPEQANLSAVDIDTRSDIYSLGVLLYELLTGSTPFEAKTLIGAGLEEMRRIIREEDPPKPSTRLNTMAQAERTSVARVRQLDPRRVGRFLRGDLDWIVMKSLEKDRSRRYETASGLAMDLRRYLDGDDVSAAPPGAGYRLRKFARRYKAALLTAAGIAAVLVAATAVSVWQAIRAGAAEKIAESRRLESESVSSFLIEAFRSPDPARDGRSITVAELIERAVKMLETSLADHPERRARLRSVLGATCIALGLSREAVPLLQQARDYYQSTAGPDHRFTLSVKQDLSRALFDAGSGEEALKLNEEVSQRRLAVFGEKDPETLLSLSNLANIYEAADQGQKCLELRQRVRDLRLEVLGPEHADTLLAINNLSISIFASGDHKEALKMREDLVNVSTRVLGEKNLGTLRAMQALSQSLFDSGSRERALDLRKKVAGLREEILGPGHSDTLGVKSDLVRSYSSAGRQKEALDLSREVYAGCKANLGQGHRYTLQAAENLAYCCFDSGLREEALELRRKLYEELKLVSPGKLATFRAGNVLAVSLFDEEQYEQALRLREEVLAARRHEFPRDRETVMAMEDLASSLVQTGEAANAARALSLRQEIREIVQFLGPKHPAVLQAMINLADSLEGAEKPAEATELRVSAESQLPPLNEAQADFTPVLREKAERLARLGQWKEAAACLARINALEPAGEEAILLAAVLARTGDEPALRKLCQGQMTIFRATSRAKDAERTARLCWLLPHEGMDLAAAHQLAAIAMERSSSSANPRLLPWAQFTRGWGFYRDGKFPEALPLLEKCVAGEFEAEGKAAAHSVLAMVQHRLKQADAARISLQKAAAILGETFNQAAGMPQSAPRGAWHNWLIARTVFQEAAGLAGEAADPK